MVDLEPAGVRKERHPGDPDPTPVAAGKRARIAHKSPTTAVVTPAGPPGRYWKRRQLARFAAGMDKPAACVLSSTRPKPSNSSRVSWPKSVSATRRDRLARPASRQTPRRSAGSGSPGVVPGSDEQPTPDPPRERREPPRSTPPGCGRRRSPPPGADQHRQRGQTCALLGLVVQK